MEEFVCHAIAPFFKCASYCCPAASHCPTCFVTPHSARAIPARPLQEHHPLSMSWIPPADTLSPRELGRTYSIACPMSALHSVTGRYPCISVLLPRGVPSLHPESPTQPFAAGIRSIGGGLLDEQARGLQPPVASNTSFSECACAQVVPSYIC